MSPILNAEGGIKKNNAAGVGNSEIHTPGKVRNSNNFGQLSIEANELLARLNELARGYPFNIMYRAKKYDPR